MQLVQLLLYILIFPNSEITEGQYPLEGKNVLDIKLQNIIYLHLIIYKWIGIVRSVDTLIFVFSSGCNIKPVSYRIILYVVMT